jgi:carboxymethylenebutenolidase
MSREPALTADEQKLNDVWTEHLSAEFSAYSADETIATMVANPRNHLVPVMIGGDGKEEVYEFYSQYFLPHIPSDMEIVTVSRPYVSKADRIGLSVDRRSHWKRCSAAIR